MYFTNNAIAPYKRKQRKDSLKKRHNDGIKDFFVKIKQKAHELITYFKQLPNSKKIVLVLSQILKLVSALYAKRVAADSKQILNASKYELGVYNGWVIDNEKLIKQYAEKISKLKNELERLWKERSTTYDGSEGGKIWRNTINGVARPKLERLVGLQESVNGWQEGVIIALKGKEEVENKIKSIETKTSMKIFISLLTIFLSSVVDYFTLRTSKPIQSQRRDSAIKRFRDISRENARRVLFVIVTAAAGFALSKLINKIRDPKHADEIRAGKLKESDYVKDFADNFLKKSSIIVPMDDPEAAEYINESLNIVRNARTIDELLSVFPGNRELMKAKRLYSELKMTRDSALKRRIDKAVRKHVRLALKDAGVKGMKKGQHVKARDPEYLKRIKGGGGMTATKPSNITSPNRKGFKYGARNKVNNIVRSFNRTTSTERQAAATKAAQKQHAAAVARSPKKIITRQAAKMNFKPAVKALALAGAGTAALLAGSKALANHRRKKAIEARRAQRNQQ